MMEIGGDGLFPSFLIWRHPLYKLVDTIRKCSLTASRSACPFTTKRQSVREGQVYSPEMLAADQAKGLKVKSLPP